MKRSWRDPLVLSLIALVVCIVIELVVVCLDLPASWDVRLSRAASMAQLLSLVAIALAFPQLMAMRDEQRRLNAQLSKHPDIQVGFASGGTWPPAGLEDQHDAETHWQVGESRSGSIVVPIKTWNRGTDSARELEWTFRFPRGTEVLRTEWDAAVSPEDDEQQVVRDRRTWLHPEDLQVHKITVRLRPSDPSDRERTVPIQVTVAMQGAPRVVRELVLVVRGPWR
jgi:hypothetical protein